MSSSNHVRIALVTMFALSGIAACDERSEIAPEPPRIAFSDGFENARDVSDLFPVNGSRWSNLQQDPVQNVVELSGGAAHSGAQCLRLVAFPGGPAGVSKADVWFDGIHLAEGDVAWFEWWLWLTDWEETKDLFLWDLEAPGTCTDLTSCPERGTGAICKSPGRRLFIGGAERRELMSDLGKWCQGDVFRQDSTLARVLPIGDWVRIRVRVKVSSRENGRLEVWQDDHKLIDATGLTLPRADAVYTRMQIGITGSGSSTAVNEVFVDDVALWVEDPGW